MAGALPVGVPDVNPKSARVTFVDETTNPPTVLGSRDLTQHGQRQRPRDLGQHGVTAADHCERAPTSACASPSAAARRPPAATPLVECYDPAPRTASLRPRLVRRRQRRRSRTRRSRATSPSSTAPAPIRTSRPRRRAARSACARRWTSVGRTCRGRSKAHRHGRRQRLPAHLSTRLRTVAVGRRRYPIAAGRRPGAGRRSNGSRRREPGGNTCKTGNGNKCNGTFGTVQRAFSATSPLRPDQARPDLGERLVLGQLVPDVQLPSTRAAPTTWWSRSASREACRTLRA